MDTATTAFLGAAEQARLLAGGTVTSRQLVDIYLERIGRLDPQLNSYRTVREDKARHEAMTRSTASTAANDGRFLVSLSRSRTTSTSPAR